MMNISFDTQLQVHDLADAILSGRLSASEAEPLLRRMHQRERNRWYRQALRDLTGHARRRVARLLQALAHPA
ncbi:hypothetical protein JCM17960_03950 [Magnetospira thiophila]